MAGNLTAHEQGLVWPSQRRKQKKGNSIRLKKGASAKNVKIFKCVQCKDKSKKETKLEDHIQKNYCMNCEPNSKCKRKYDVHNLKHNQENNFIDIEKCLISTCQCKDEHLDSCKNGKFIGTKGAHYGRHTKKHHSQKPEAISRRK